MTLRCQKEHEIFLSLLELPQPSCIYLRILLLPLSGHMTSVAPSPLKKNWGILNSM